ncbi:MAG TPA: hypothetical protein VIU15_46635 [Streptomyces sp.]
MSTPPPQGPYGPGPYGPNPYGQPPAAPGPYGQQPPAYEGAPYGPPQQAPYGVQSPYGQPPQGQPPYGQPPYRQPPYGQPPYGQPPYGQPWGAPAPLPPRKRRLGLVLGIVASVLALLTVAAVSRLFVGGSDKGFPEAEYKLTLPNTLLDGRYHFAEDMSQTLGGQIERESGAWNARDVKAVVARYEAGAGQPKGGLAVSGMYGRFKDTAGSRKSMMKGVGEADNTSIAVAPEDYTLPGADTTITCEVAVQERLGTKLTYPVCAWVDGNTGATVAEISAESIAQKPEDVDLEAAARTALKVRQETRQPI